MQYNKRTLENGSRLVTIAGLSTNAVTISAFVRAGFRFDPHDKPGLAHFAEHMVFNGTKSFPSVKEEANAIEPFGGYHRAFTWIEHQKHTVHLPKSHFEEGVKLLMETLYSPSLLESEVEKERGIIKEEILKNKSNLSRSIWDYVWHPLFFQGTHLARPYTGTENDLESISSKDIQNFINNHFTPTDTVVFVAGNFEEKLILNAVEENVHIFKDKSKGIKTHSPLNPKRTKRVLTYKDKSYYQTSLCIGIPTVAYGSPKKPLLDIIREILGGYSGTNLVQTLRNEGGLVYGWNCYREYLNDTGYLMFNVSTAHKSVEKVASIILDEFARLASGELTDDEIEIAKGHLIGSTYANIETGEDYIEWYGLQELLNPQNVLDIEEKEKIYKRIANDDIRRIAAKYLSKEKILIGAIGNVDESTLASLLT